MHYVLQVLAYGMGELAMHRRHPTAFTAHGAANDNSKSDSNLMDAARARRLQHCCADALRVLLPSTNSSNSSASTATKQSSSPASLQHSASVVTPRATVVQHQLLSSHSAAVLKQSSRQHLSENSTTNSSTSSSSSSSKWTAAHMDASDLAAVLLTALAWVLDSGAGERSSDPTTAIVTDTFTTAPTVLNTAVGVEHSNTNAGLLVPEAFTAELQQQQQLKLSRQQSKQLLLRPKSLAVLLEHTASADSSSSSGSTAAAALYSAPSENAESSLSSTLRRVSSKATKQQALAADYRPVRTADAVARELQQGIAPLDATVLHLLQALLLSLEPGAGEYS
jgi:hypothetical protein